MQRLVVEAFSDLCETRITKRKQCLLVKLDFLPSDKDGQCRKDAVESVVTSCTELDTLERKLAVASGFAAGTSLRVS